MAFQNKSLFVLQSHITRVMRRSMSMRAVLHSLGYFFAALNANLTNSAEPTGSMVFSIPSGKTKCVPCSYTTASTSQECGSSTRRFSIRRIYFAVSQSASSSAPTRNSSPRIFSTFMNILLGNRVRRFRVVKQLAGGNHIAGAFGSRRDYAPIVRVLIAKRHVWQGLSLVRKE